MAQTIAVVTFYCRSGATEKLATAAAVGAVQARAGIRMRRMPDADLDDALKRFPQSVEALRRMHREYVAPREADVLAADVLIFGTPSDVSASAAVWAPLFAVLEKLQAEGKLAGKVGAVVGDGEDTRSFASAIGRLGLHPLTSAESADAVGDAASEVERAVALGRQAVGVAEAMKQNARP